LKNIFQDTTENTVVFRRKTLKCWERRSW